MKQFTNEQKIYRTLQIAIAMCYIGHGAFGIITKAVWCNYFAVFGIGHDWAYRLMPYIGTFDILMGITMLLFPVAAIPVSLVIWGIFTALLRPLSGEPFAEFIERTGNFGVPLALLILLNNKAKIKYWFNPIKSDDVVITNNIYNRLEWCLRITVFLLFAGHGWLNLIEKRALLNQYTSLGLSNPSNIAYWIGIFEILSAFLVLIRPSRSTLIALFIWKMGSELFYPQYELFEWIERGASYGAILALCFTINMKPSVLEKDLKSEIKIVAAN